MSVQLICTCGLDEANVHTISFKEKAMQRFGFIAVWILAFTFSSVVCGSEGAVEFYVPKQGTWQETLRLRRERLVEETGKGSTDEERRAIWRQVQEDFNTVDALVEMTMDKTERIWDADWRPGDLKELARRYAKAARATKQYKPVETSFDPVAEAEKLADEVSTGEQLQKVRETYYAAFRLMENLVLREADENIEKYRMGTLIVKASPGAKVKVEQTRHDFLFGTSLNDQMWATKADFDDLRVWGDDFEWLNEKWRYEFIEANRERYYQLIRDNFNIGVFQNAAKWFNVEPGEGNIYWTSAERTTKWALENGLAMRGHCVIWGCERFVPGWQKEMSDAELRRVIERRCKEVANWFAGRVDDWDLNNEMLHCRWYRDRLGDDIVVDMFKWFKEANPEASLALNDFNILNNRYQSRLDDYIAGARELMHKGAVLGGINCQAHSWGGVTNIGFLKEALDRLRRTDLGVKISEYIIDDQAGNKEYAAVMLDKHFRVCFGHPAVEAIIFWGICEGTHFSPSDALWRKDFSPTPPAVTYRKLVFDEWWTRWEGEADAKGECRVPVFYGKHCVSVNGEETAVEFARAEGTEKILEAR